MASAGWLDLALHCGTHSSVLVLKECYFVPGLFCDVLSSNVIHGQQEIVLTRTGAHMVRESVRFNRIGGAITGIQGGEEATNGARVVFARDLPAAAAAAGTTHGGWEGGCRRAGQQQLCNNSSYSNDQCHRRRTGAMPRPRGNSHKAARAAAIGGAVTGGRMVHRQGSTIRRCVCGATHRRWRFRR